MFHEKLIKKKARQSARKRRQKNIKLLIIYCI
jgi:hypothetical protein